MSRNKYINADAINLSHLISDAKGFYIPEYQRPYTWQKEHIERMMETIEMAFHSYLDEDYFAFFGAILVLDNSVELEQLYGIKPIESPERVYALIDGQQRITSLILLISQIYKKLKSYDLDEFNTDELKPLKNAVTATLTKSISAIAAPNTINQAKLLPKIINGRYDDKWYMSKNGVYHSPVAEYLISIINDKNTNIDQNIEKLLLNMETVIEKFMINNTYVDKLVNSNYKNFPILTSIERFKDLIIKTPYRPPIYQSLC